MLEHLPVDVQNGLAEAARRAARRKSRLYLHIGDAIFPVIRMWDTGFAVDSARLSNLRGFVEIHEGQHHRWSGLIMASEINDGELICTFKRISPAHNAPAADYWRGEAPVAGLLADR